jgi:hypothetical protein
VAVLVSSLTTTINSLNLPPLAKSRLLGYVQQIPTAVAGLTPQQKLAGVTRAQALITYVKSLPPSVLPAAQSAQIVSLANQIIAVLKA